MGDAVGEPRVARRPVPAGRRSPSRLHARAGAELRAVDASCATPTASRSSRAGGWAPGRRSTSPSPVAEEWWRAQAKRLLALGVEGIKADDGEGWYLPDDVRFADGRPALTAAWGHGLLYRRSMQRALDEVHPGAGVLFGRPRLDGPAGGRRDLGRRPAVGLLVAAHARGGDADRGRVRASRTGRTTSAATSASGSSSRCPKELLLRWVQFGCFTPLMQAHGRFEQEPWTYDEETLERLPGVRAAARAARPVRARGGG